MSKEELTKANEQLQESINNQAAAASFIGNLNLQRDFLILGLSARPSIRNFSNWLLGFIGATFLLSINKYEVLTNKNIISLDSLIFFWKLLIGVTLLSFLARVLDTFIESNCCLILAAENIEKKSSNFLKTEQENLDTDLYQDFSSPNIELNFEEAKNTLRSALPGWAKPLFNYGFKRGSRDILVTHKLLIKVNCYFLLLSGLQLIVFIFSYIYLLYKFT